MVRINKYKAMLTDAWEFVPSGHFYSAVPSYKDRETHLNSQEKTGRVLGIELNDRQQCELLRQFSQYYKECPFPEKRTGESRYYYQNPAYSYTDALMLYSMMRHFKPRRIIEIGSGFSSCAMMDISEHFFDGNLELTFIEPFPKLLYSLMRENDKKHTILPVRLQEVDLKIFESLSENDILFIDSSHVSKLDSDVNRIFFEILPLLKKNVLVHFHDIFWPFEYPDQWIREGRAWNECYMLRAFLACNDSYDILLFASYLEEHNRELLKKYLPLCLKGSGASIWIQKLK